MKSTRKLQFAAELIDEAAEEAEKTINEERLRDLSSSVDEMRPVMFQESVVRHVEQQEVADS